MDLQIGLLPLALFASFLCLLLRALTNKKPQEPPLPPGPWRLPFLGHIHHLAGKPPHRALRDLAATHGPVLFLKMGQVNLVAVSSRAASEAVLKTHDANFASRPELEIAKVVLYGCSDLLFSPHGDYWRQMRKVCTTELLSPKRVRSSAAVREEQIFKLVRDVESAPRAMPLNLSEKFLAMANDVIAATAVGVEFELQKKNFLPVVREVIALFSGFSFGDLFPCLKFVDAISGANRRLERYRRKIDEMLDEIIAQHRAKKKAPRLPPGQETEEEDLVDVLLRIKDQGNLEIPITLDNIKAVILDMFLGATDTSASVLEWTMSELVRNPEMMEKAQDEVRAALEGKITRIRQSDVEGLKYLKMVIKETMRVHTPAPLLAPRVAKETCELLGYKIPAGSRLVVNAWALARDPDYWDDPDSFKPERFDDGNPVDFRGANFEYIPFGAGKRMCPGIQYGVSNLELVLAQLLFYFDWELPQGMRPEDLDMTEVDGASAARKVDLLLFTVPRIPLPDV